jgi:hypothetical protein
MIETFATRSPHTVARIVAAIAAALASGEYRFGALVIDSRTSSRSPTRLFVMAAHASLPVPVGPIAGG